MTEFNPFLTVTGQFPVMIGTLLYVTGSRECHSELTEETHIPVGPIPKGRHSSSLEFPLTKQITVIGRPKEGNSAEFTSSGKC